MLSISVADPEGAKGAMAPPGPVKIGHKKDGRQRRPHRFHVSRPPLTRLLDPLLYLNAVLTRSQRYLNIYIRETILRTKVSLRGSLAPGVREQCLSIPTTSEYKTLVQTNLILMVRV